MILFLCTAIEFTTPGLIVCPSTSSSSAIGDSFPYPFVSNAYACLLCCSLSIFSSLFPSFWSYSSHISSFDLPSIALQSMGNPLKLTIMVVSNLSVAYQDVSSLHGSLMCVFSFDEEQISPLSLSLLKFLFLLLPLPFKCSRNRRFVKSDIDVLSSFPGELPYPVWVRKHQTTIIPDNRPFLSLCFVVEYEVLRRRMPRKSKGILGCCCISDGRVPSNVSSFLN